MKRQRLRVVLPKGANARLQPLVKQAALKRVGPSQQTSSCHMPLSIGCTGA